MTDLSHPAAVMSRLTEIEADLAQRQNLLEAAAMRWFRLKRDREREHAVKFIEATGTDGQRKAKATAETANIGREAEGEYEALKAVVRVLEARATIGQSILRSQGRV